MKFPVGDAAHEHRLHAARTALLVVAAKANSTRTPQTTATQPAPRTVARGLDETGRAMNGPMLKGDSGE